MKPSLLRVDVGEPMLWKDEGRIHLGAEAEVRAGFWLGIPAVKKIRMKRTWRHPDLDHLLTRRRLDAECRSLRRLVGCGIRIPSILQLDRNTFTMVMSKVDGEPLIDVLRAGISDDEIFSEVGRVIRIMHRVGIVHGDLSTNNILWQHGGTPALVDLGLSRVSTEVEQFGIDLHVLEEILSASHPEYDGAMTMVESGYLSLDIDEGPAEDSSGGPLPSAAQVIKRLQDIRTRVRYHG